MAFIHRELRSLLTADTQHHCSQTDFNERMFRGMGKCDPKTAHKLPALTPKDPQPQATTRKRGTAGIHGHATAADKQYPAEST